MRLVILAGFISAIVATTARAGVIVGPIVFPENGDTYYLLSQDTWTNSEAEAVALGGTLATVTNDAENSFLSTTFGNDRNLWIGLYDPSQDSLSGEAHAANFVWASGDTSTYRNWSVSEPNNTNAQNEWYTLMWGYQSDIAADPAERVQGTWDDIDNDATPGVNLAYGVVEVSPAPEPATFGIAAFACSLLLLPRRRSV